MKKPVLAMIATSSFLLSGCFSLIGMGVGSMREKKKAKAAENESSQRLHTEWDKLEKKYGEPMQKWIDIADERLAAGEAHMKVVEFFKAEHGMGHGHANALVGWVKQQRG